jgi:hypothetical protein
MTRALVVWMILCPITACLHRQPRGFRRLSLPVAFLLAFRRFLGSQGVHPALTSRLRGRNLHLPQMPPWIVMPVVTCASSVNGNREPTHVLTALGLCAPSTCSSAIVATVASALFVATRILKGDMIAQSVAVVRDRRADSSQNNSYYLNHPARKV